jgi:hypothetical protein
MSGTCDETGVSIWDKIDCRLIDAVMAVPDVRLRNRLARFAARHTPEERPRRQATLLDRKSLAAGQQNEHGGLDVDARDL